jgi:hypothetical protein
MSSLSFLPTLNLKNLKEIDDYKKAHDKDFRQVFFKIDPNNIKSERVGVFIKDTNNQDRVQPFKTLPGLHTAETCKLNAAAIANSTINYQSPDVFSAGNPGLKYTVVAGDFAGNPNYFLSAEQVSSETADPIAHKSSGTLTGAASVEVFGYISAEKPGRYRVDLKGKTPPKNMLLWIGNNALKTYRKENAMFVVENNVLTKSDAKVNLVTGEYTPFRMQYTFSEPEVSVVDLLFNDDNYPIRIFATSKTENTLFYYSLKPQTFANYYECSIFKGDELKKFITEDNTRATNGTEQVIKVFEQSVPTGTSFIALDLVGNLWAYDSNNDKLEIVIDIQGCGDECTAINFELNYDESIDIGVPPVKNKVWQSRLAPGTFIKQKMTNQTEQVGDKRISKDRITETIPYVSENYKFMFLLTSTASGEKALVMVASVADDRTFYTAEPDIKMNKLFYASTFLRNKYLKEVPSDLKTTATSTSYSVYKEMYPNAADTSTEIDCNTGCGATCEYYYKVTDSNNATKCYTQGEKTPTFFPQQPDSAFKTSELYIKNPVIHTSDSAKNSVYASTAYIPNGFEHSAERRFSDYPVEQTPLSAADVPGPEGTSYVTELLNQVHLSTSGRKKISNPIEMKPMVAGKIENFQNTVNEDSMIKLADTEKLMNTYLSYQNQINRKKLDISGNVDSVNSLYGTMSDPANNKKYDFTGDKIYSLEEDRTLKTALLKDNAIYLAEQNNLNLIGTITMATLILAAIFVSK